MPSGGAAIAPATIVIRTYTMQWPISFHLRAIQDINFYRTVANPNRAATAVESKAMYKPPQRVRWPRTFAITTSPAVHREHSWWLQTSRGRSAGGIGSLQTDEASRYRIMTSCTWPSAHLLLGNMLSKGTRCPVRG